MLLVMQATFGVLACPNRFASASDGGAVCTAHGLSVPNDGDPPAKTPQHDCPACLSFACHVSAILTPQLDIVAPDIGMVFAFDVAVQVPGEDLPALHNRGPPLELPA